MRYLRAEDILIIHSELIDQTGGLHGVRDTGLLFSIVEKPKMIFGGKELYRGVFNKAAATYLESFRTYALEPRSQGSLGLSVAQATRVWPISSLKSTFETRRTFSTSRLKPRFCLELGQTRKSYH